MSRRGDERSDSGARQQQTQWLGATRPAFLPPRDIIPALSPCKPLAQLNNDRVFMRQHVSTACPARHAGESHQGHLLCLHELPSLPLAEEKCSLKGETKTNPEPHKGLIDIRRTPDARVSGLRLKALILNTFGLKIVMRLCVAPTICTYSTGRRGKNREEPSGK